VHGALALLALTSAAPRARPSDVAAGFALGVAWVGGVALLVRLPGTTVLRS
jgi:hypothetical protein